MNVATELRKVVDALDARFASGNSSAEYAHILTDEWATMREAAIALQVANAQLTQDFNDNRARIAQLESLAAQPVVSSPSAVEVTDYEKLRAFARDMLENFWEAEDPTRQDLGLKHGLLVEVQVAGRCGESCSCADYDADFPGVCYRYAPILKTALTAALRRE